MTVKLRFAALLLVLLAPVALAPAAQPPAAPLEGLSPLDGARSASCSSQDCAAQCDPCGWRFYGCYEGEAICACWNC